MLKESATAYITFWQGQVDERVPATVVQKLPRLWESQGAVTDMLSST